MTRHFAIPLALVLTLAAACEQSAAPEEKSGPGPAAGMAMNPPIRMVPPGKKAELTSSNNLTSPALPSELTELVALLGQPSTIPVRTLHDTIKGYGLQALPSLLKMLTDANHHVRLATVKLLGEFKEHAREIAPHLIALLKTEPMVQIRSMTIDALARLELFSEEVQQAFLRALSDSGWLVRWEAVRGLGGFGDKAKSFVPHLEKMLEDANTWVQLYTAISLLRIQGSSEKASKHLVTLALDADVRFRLNVVAQIETLPPGTCPQTAPALLKLLADPDVKVRRVASRAVGTCAPHLPRSAAIVDPLKQAEQDADHSVRVHATEALGKLPSTTP